ncbi:hypothetical protein ACFL0Q_07650 [Thermodesulfobacteriota bacterium]
MEIKKLRRITSFRKGRVWLKVLEAKDGTELFTIHRSLKAAEEWRSSPVFQLLAGDAESIRNVLERYERLESGEEEQVC